MPSRPSLVKRLARSVAHVRALWGAGFVFPLIPAFYAVGVAAIGDLRPEHAVIGVLCALVAFGTPATKQFFIDVAPYLIVAFGYDLVRYARQAVLSADRVLGCELRSAELSLFSVAPGVTPQDWFARHHNPVLDLICAVPYTIFVYVAFIYAEGRIGRDHAPGLPVPRPSGRTPRPRLLRSRGAPGRDARGVASCDDADGLPAAPRPHGGLSPRREPDLTSGSAHVAVGRA